MSIEAGCYSFLTGVTALTAIVGTRIYPNSLPQNPVFPALTYALVSAPHDHTLTDAAGIVRARIQFDAYGYKLSEAVAITEAIRLALQRYTGSFGAKVVLASKLANEQDLSIAPQDASQSWLYRKSSDYIIKLRELIP